QWNNMHRPSALCMTHGRCPLCYVGEIGPYLEANRGWPNVGPRISILSHEGAVLARIAATPSAGTGPCQCASPHAIAADSRADIYVGEVAQTGWPSLFPGEPLPPGLRGLRKFARITSSPAAAEGGLSGAGAE